jgi:hypothetical protein
VGHAAMRSTLKPIGYRLSYVAYCLGPYLMALHRILFRLYLVALHTILIPVMGCNAS